MSKIIRRILSKDFDGNIFSSRIERLVDDGAGTIEENYETSVTRCEACGRPVEKADEIRGHCILCGKSSCSLCAGTCSICGRGPFCGRCRTGFPEKNQSVCANCLLVLRERLAYQDALLERKATFERTLAVYEAQMKLVQLLQHNKGGISQAVVRLAQMRVTRRIVRLEKELQRENDRGRPLLR